MDEAGNFRKLGEDEEKVLVTRGATAGEVLVECNEDEGGLPSTPLWEVVVDTTGSATTLYVCAGLAFGSQHGGVFASTSAGVDWDCLYDSFPNDFVLSLARDKNENGILLAGTDGDGMYRTTDGGTNWLSVLGSQKTREIVFDDSGGSIVFCGNEGTGVFKSTDNGVNWYASNAGMSLVNAVGVAVDPSDSNRIYAIWQALNSGGVFLTTDGGNTWTPAPNLPSQRQTGIAVDPADGNIVYVCNSGPWNAGMDDGVYKSTDGGTNWFTNWTFPDTAELHSVSVAPSDPNIIFAGGNKWLQPFGTRIWKSTDAGGNWSLVYDNPSKEFVEVGTIAINPLNPLVAYGGARANGATVIGVLKTTDGGTSWDEMNNGLSNLSILSLAIDPSDTSRILAGTAGGVFISTDGATNWSATDSLGYTKSVTVRPDSIAYAGTLGDGVFRSVDFGGTWTPFSGGISVIRTINHLAIDPSHADRVYAALSNVGVYATVDTGSYTWHAIGPFGGDVNCIAIVAACNQMLFAGTQDGLFRSTDGGGFWEKCEGGPTGEIHEVATSPSGDTVYVGSGSYFRSLDAGSTWTEIALPTAPYEAPEAVAIDPYNPLVIYLGIGSYLSGTYCHVLKSTDGGGAWEFKCGGLPFSSTMGVSSIGINPMNTLKLYATFGSGFFGTSDFYVSNDGGEIWTHPVGIEEEENAVHPSSIRRARLFQNQPNPFCSRTTVLYEIPTGGHVSVKIYDLSGRLVATLIDGYQDAGVRKMEWDGRSETGGKLPSSVYFVKFMSGNHSFTKELVLVR